MPTTLAAAKADRALKLAANIDPASTAGAPIFTSLVNESVRHLIKYGDWWATVVKANLAVFSSDVVWPAWVGTPLAVNVNRHGWTRRGHAFSYWYDMLPMERGDYPQDRDCREFHSDIRTITDGTTPVLQNIPPGYARFVKMLADTNSTAPSADDGKVITVYGIDANGLPAKENLTLPATSSTQFQMVTRVSKAVTVNVIQMYQIDESNNQILMGLYGAGETEPMYRHSKIHGVHSNSTTATNITLLAKLEFVPVVADADVIQIDNLDALHFMFLAIKQKDAHNAQQYEAFRAEALRELNAQLDDKFPVTQTAISNLPFGRTRIGRQQMF